MSAFLEAFCGEAGVERDRCLRLNIVLEELFVNTVSHGHRGDCDAPVWITLEARPDAVHVTYEDTAPPFNPFVHAVQARKVGGLGVLLARELAASLAPGKIIRSWPRIQPLPGWIWPHCGHLRLER